MIHAPIADLIGRRNGEIASQALPDWEAVLFGPEGLQLQEWRTRGCLEVVKQGAHRTVYRVELPGRAFYVKHYRRERLLDGVSHLVRPSAARREWHKAAEVARRGIPTVKPLAWAERIHGGLVRDNYLVTEAIPDAYPLEQYVADHLPRLPAKAQRAMRRALIEGAARFVAAIHRAGIVHDDFHVGNVLIQPPPPHPAEPTYEASPRFHLIDLPGVRFASGPLKWPASRASLIMFASGWWHRTSKTERLRFWRTYLSHRPELRLPDPRSAVEAIHRKGHDYCLRVARRRDKRALRTNRDYIALRQPDGEAHGVVDLGRPELDRFLANPEGLLAENVDRPVKLGHGKVIVEAQLPIHAAPLHLAYARFRHRNRWKAFLGRFRRGRALRGWCSGHALLQRDIATPRPILVAHPRHPANRPQSYLATEWIEGAENLHLYGWRLAAQSPEERLRRAARAAESLGELVGRMHAWQIAHGDLKASNLLIVDGAGSPQTYVIDAEDVRITRRLTSAQRLRDLARLATSLQAHPWVTPAILCRFLRTYLRQLPEKSLDWKQLWRAVSRRTDGLIRRKRRQRKPVL